MHKSPALESYSFGGAIYISSHPSWCLYCITWIEEYYCCCQSFWFLMVKEGQREVLINIKFMEYNWWLLINWRKKYLLWLMFHIKRWSTAFGKTNRIWKIADRWRCWNLIVEIYVRWNKTKRKTRRIFIEENLRKRGYKNKDADFFFLIVIY